ncbi:DNA-3-methyladenine glycosylase 2 family protein [Actinomadura sp. SCN-SB]|uniref:DNA-3-methyladenine glycosylase 2 family protein n=1 Tax=Actinomadura sp. SCN-SB TaxID=3373092 RepID=UPI00374FE450
MHEDVERCVRAVQSKDARFDGWFYTGVVTTGIYCRPSCPAVPPKPENMRFYPSAAAAQQAGFRACKRCRPDASPGSPEWNHRADVVARAMRLIAEGVVDREGVPGLAARLGYSTRQIERQLSAELGAGPLALARAQRAQTARLLIETSALPMSEVAFAAGFASIRAFNDTVREVFALTPTELRDRVAKGRPPAGSGTLSLRLPFRAPLCPDNLFGHLAATAVPGVEEWRDGAYRRTMRLPHGHAVVALCPHPDHVACALTLTDLRDLTTAISRCRRLLDLDADPTAVDDLLRADPVLAPLVDKAPGRRVPRTVDPAEFAVRAVLGQQVSTAAARTHAARLVVAHGEPVTDPGTGLAAPDHGHGGLTHLFPTAAALAETDPLTLAFPRTRRATFAALATALAAGEIDLGAGGDWDEARAKLGALPGIGPWTIETIAMRALGDPDAFVPTDLGVRAAAHELGLPSTPAALTRRAAAWRPWRAYAVQYLWATGDHAINRLPAA